jgi:hypothetical protein
MSSMRVTVIVLCTAVFVVAGCGGSKNSTTTTTTSAGNVTTSGTAGDAGSGTTTGDTAGSSGTSGSSASTELVTNANTICKHVHARLIALTKGNTENVEHLYSRAAAYEQTALGELQKLSPPGTWKPVVVAISTLAEDSKKYAEYSRTKDTSAADKLSQSYVVVKRAGVVAATHVGLHECALAL